MLLRRNRLPEQRTTKLSAGDAGVRQQLEHLLDRTRVAVWIHGHMHDPAAYAINGSRVICNPRGYPGESATGRFDPTLCVEV